MCFFAKNKDIVRRSAEKELMPKNHALMLPKEDFFGQKSIQWILLATMILRYNWWHPH